MSKEGSFKVGFPADFLDEGQHHIFSDIGLSLLDSKPSGSYDFLEKDGAEYAPHQIAGYDVLITMKPRVTADSLRGIERLCAIGRCGVGYDNVDFAACTEHNIAVHISPGGVVRPMAEFINSICSRLSHNMRLKDAGQRVLESSDANPGVELSGRSDREYRMRSRSLTA